MKTIYKFNHYFLLAALLVMGVVSCTKKDAYLGYTPGTGAPTVASVHTISKSVVDSALITTTTTYDATGMPTTTTNHNYNPQVVAFDSTTTTGKGGNYYEIVGTNLGSATSVTFNGATAYFNRALASDTHLFVILPTTAPFGPNQIGSLVITTTHGKVAFKFSILQPPPSITAISPLAGAAGDTIYIAGTVLDNATSVKFGTVPATIVSNTPTLIKALIPAGVVQAFVFVTTPGGTAESSSSFGFKYIIYADDRTPGWGGNSGGYTGYSGTVFDFASTAHVKRGTNAIAVTFGGAYSAAQIGYGGPNISVSALGLTAVKFSVYGGAGSVTGDQFQVAINGQYTNIIVKITAGAYTDFTIPLSKFGNLTNITEFVLQTFQGSSETIYIDDLGFI